MKAIIWPAIYLALISSIAAAALAVTNEQTKPEILKATALKRQNGMRNVLPGLADPREVADENGRYVGCILGHDANGALLGYVVELEVKGYDPTTKLSLVVGLKPDLSVSGVEILRDKETPGLGKKASEKRKPGETKAEKPVWLDQFEGLSGEQINLKKNRPDEGKVDAITASTITSQAVVDGVRQAVALVKKLRADGLLKTAAEQRAQADEGE